MRPRRRPVLVALLVLAALAGGSIPAASAAGPAAAQEAAWPTRPIKLIVPFPPGGYADLLGRLIAKDITDRLGQPGVVDNRAGAGGNIGAELAAKSPPDGYTLFLGTIGPHAINAALYGKLPFEPIRDFTPIAFIADAETVLVVHPSVPARSTAELVALARKEPDRLTFASAGSGSTGHLAAELFKAATGTALVHVPYKGNAPAMTDLVNGQVGLSFATLQTALPFIKAGKLVALATVGGARSAALPDVPTLAEAGVPGIEVRNWTGLLAPAGAPPAVVARLAAQIDRLMRSPEMQTLLREQGLSYSEMGPDAFAGFIRAEAEKWGKVVTAVGARAE